MSTPHQNALVLGGGQVIQAGRDLYLSPPSPEPLAVWKVPPRNPNFTGREAVLDRVDEALRSTGVAVLRGMGGVGKTRLAVEYAHRFAEAFDVVWWVPASRPEVIGDHLAELGARLGLADTDPAAVLGALHGRRRLLVFDDAEDPRQLRRFLPSGPGHAVITTRRAGFDALGSVVEVDVLRRAESVALLTRRVPSIDVADDLAELLSDLPLAVEQASAYLGATGMPAAQYLSLFRTRTRDMLGRGRVADHEATLATLWDLSTATLARRAPAAAALLDLLSWLAPEPVPLDLFTAHAPLLPTALARVVDDPVALAEAVGALVDLYLVRRDGNEITVAHRLLQQSVRRRHDPVPHARCRRLLEADLSDRISAAPESRPRWRALLPHVLAVCDDAPEGRDGGPLLLGRAGAYLRVHGRSADARTLLARAVARYPDVVGPRHELGLALLNLGRPAEALPLFEHALAATESAHGPEHPYVAVRLSGLAGALRDLGRPAEALPLLRRALTITEAARAPGHPDVAEALAGLADVLITLRRGEEARPLLERALGGYEAVHGIDHPLVSKVLGSTAALLASEGRISEAHVLLERGLRAVESTYGPDHPVVAAWSSTVGDALMALGRTAEARAHVERALTITEAVYGLDHPSVATRLAMLAAVLRWGGRPAEALPLLERALTTAEAALGPNHPVVGRMAGDLGYVLCELGRPLDGMALLERGLSIAEATWGPDGPALVTNLTALGLALRDLGRPGEALAVLQRAASLAEAEHGPDHLATALRLHDVAVVLAELHRPQEARALLERALHFVESTYGPDHHRVPPLLDSLATVLRADDHAARLDLAERSVRIREARFGQDHPEVAVAVTNLAVALTDAGRVAETPPLYSRALRIMESAHRGGHISVAAIVGHLATAHMALGRHAQAESLWRRALSIIEAVRGPDHPNLVVHLTNLGTTLHALNRLEDARACYERALEIADQDSPALVTVLSGLADVLRDLGRPDEARSLAERALAIVQSTATSPAAVVEHLTTTAALRHFTGRPEQTGPLLDRALALAGDPFAVLAHLGHKLRAFGDFRAAALHYERALAIAEDPPEFAPFLVVYAETLLADHRPAEARPVLDRALAAARDDDEVIAVLGLQGRVLQDLGAHEQAHSVLTRALAIADTRPPDVRTALLWRTLGTTLVSLELLEDATRARSTALMLAEAALGHDSPVVGAVLAELGDAFRRRGLPDQARLLLERAVAVLEAAHGPDHPDTTTARKALAVLPNPGGRDT